MSDLLQRMRVSRKRVYTEYGSKEALFLAVVRAYIQRHAAPRIAQLRSGPQGLSAVERFLRHWRFGTGFKGCLLSNSAAECENLSPEILALIRDHSEQLSDALRQNLIHAQAQGEIAAGESPAALATYLISCSQGLTILGKLSPSPEAAEQVIRSVMSGLRTSRPNTTPVGSTSGPRQEVIPARPKWEPETAGIARSSRP